MYYKGNGTEQDNIKAFYWFVKSAEQGEARAQSNLAVMYYKHYDDIEKAIHWAKLSAEQGLADGQYQLGFLYSKQGKYLEAIEWCEKAAKQGQEAAIRDLKVFREEFNESVDLLNIRGISLN